MYLPCRSSEVSLVCGMEEEIWACAPDDWMTTVFQGFCCCFTGTNHILMGSTRTSLIFLLLLFFSSRKHNLLSWCTMIATVNHTNASFLTVAGCLAGISMMFYKSTTISMYLASKLVEVRCCRHNRALYFSFIELHASFSFIQLHRLCQNIPA